MGKTVKEYYSDSFDEDNRHNIDAFGIIQVMRTKEILNRSIGQASASVLDVGGATGVYSFYLAEQGHEVSLLDVVPSHIQAAQKRNQNAASKIRHFYLGDARTVDIEVKFDVIILHGPLYHITDRVQRIELLRRMKTLLKPGGIILAFAISRYAGYFYGVRSGKILDDNYRRTVLAELETGIRDRDPGWFYHKDSELALEATESGLVVTDLLSVTSQMWMLPDIEEQIQNAEYLETVLEIARATERHTSIAQDLVCVAR